MAPPVEIERELIAARALIQAKRAALASARVTTSTTKAEWLQALDAVNRQKVKAASLRRMWARCARDTERAERELAQASERVYALEIELNAATAAADANGSRR